MKNSVPCKGFVKKFGRKHGNNFIFQFAKYQLGISEVVCYSYRLYNMNFNQFLALSCSFSFCKFPISVSNLMSSTFSFHFKERVPSKFAQT